MRNLSLRHFLSVSMVSVEFSQFDVFVEVQKNVMTELNIIIEDEFLKFV
jgi:hypothetical protein